MKISAGEILFFIFAAGTIGLIYFSWHFSLKEKRYHGISRFFAFDAIFGLVLLNARVWFKNPLQPHQIVSWIFLAGSMVLAGYGFYLLNRIGKPEGQMENTTILITRGLYKYIRHPLYCSLMVLAFGVFLKDASIIGALLALVSFLALYATAKVEEKEMTAKFGAQYEAYMQTTRMFIPCIF